MKKDRLFNSVVIVLTIFAAGGGLIIWPLRGYLTLATEQIRAGRNWVPLVAGVAYVVGFFVTRTVEDAFNAIFGKVPFCDIGEKNNEQPKHPKWVDHMLAPLGYALFFALVVGIIAVMILLLHGGLWLINLTRGGSVPRV